MTDDVLRLPPNELEGLLIKTCDFILVGAEGLDLNKYAPYIDKIRPLFASSLERRIYNGLERFVYGEDAHRFLEQFPYLKKCIDTAATLRAPVNEFCAKYGNAEIVEGAVKGTLKYLIKNDLVAAFINSVVLNNRLNRICRELDALGIEKNVLGYLNVLNFVCEKDYWVVNSSLPSSLHPPKDDYVSDMEVEVGTEDLEHPTARVRKRRVSSEPKDESVFEDEEGSAHKIRRTVSSAIKQSNLKLPANYSVKENEESLRKEHLKLIIYKVKFASCGCVEMKRPKKSTRLKLPCKPDDLIDKIFKVDNELAHSCLPPTRRKFEEAIYNVCSCLNDILSRMDGKSIQNLCLTCEIRPGYISLKLKPIVIPPDGSKTCLFSARVATCRNVGKNHIKHDKNTLSQRHHIKESESDGPNDERRDKQELREGLARQISEFVSVFPTLEGEEESKIVSRTNPYAEVLLPDVKEESDEKLNEIMAPDRDSASFSETTVVIRDEFDDSNVSKFSCSCRHVSSGLRNDFFKIEMKLRDVPECFKKVGSAIFKDERESKAINFKADSAGKEKNEENNSELQESSGSKRNSEQQKLEKLEDLRASDSSQSDPPLTESAAENPKGESVPKAVNFQDELDERENREGNDSEVQESLGPKRNSEEYKLERLKDLHPVGSSQSDAPLRELVDTETYSHKIISPSLKSTRVNQAPPKPSERTNRKNQFSKETDAAEEEFRDRRTSEPLAEYRLDVSNSELGASINRDDVDNESVSSFVNFRPQDSIGSKNNESKNEELAVSAESVLEKPKEMPGSEHSSLKIHPLGSSISRAEAPSSKIEEPANSSVSTFVYLPVQVTPNSRNDILQQEQLNVLDKRNRNQSNSRIPIPIKEKIPEFSHSHELDSSLSTPCGNLKCSVKNVSSKEFKQDVRQQPHEKSFATVDQVRDRRVSKPSNSRLSSSVSTKMNSINYGKICSCSRTRLDKASLDAIDNCSSITITISKGIDQSVSESLRSFDPSLATLPEAPGDILKRRASKTSSKTNNRDVLLFPGTRRSACPEIKIRKNGINEARVSNSINSDQFNPASKCIIPKPAVRRKKPNFFDVSSSKERSSSILAKQCECQGPNDFEEHAVGYKNIHSDNSKQGSSNSLMMDDTFRLNNSERTLLDVYQRSQPEQVSDRRGMFASDSEEVIGECDSNCTCLREIYDSGEANSESIQNRDTTSKIINPSNASIDHLKTNRFPKSSQIVEESRSAEFAHKLSDPASISKCKKKECLSSEDYIPPKRDPSLERIIQKLEMSPFKDSRDLFLKSKIREIMTPISIDKRNRMCNRSGVRSISVQTLEQKFPTNGPKILPKKMTTKCVNIDLIPKDSFISLEANVTKIISVVDVTIFEGDSTETSKKSLDVPKTPIKEILNPSSVLLHLNSSYRLKNPKFHLKSEPQYFTPGFPPSLRKIPNPELDERSRHCGGCPRNYRPSENTPKREKTMRGKVEEVGDAWANLFSRTAKKPTIVNTLCKPFSASASRIKYLRAKLCKMLLDRNKTINASKTFVSNDLYCVSASREKNCCTPIKICQAAKIVCPVSSKSSVSVNCRKKRRTVYCNKKERMAGGSDTPFRECPFKIGSDWEFDGRGPDYYWIRKSCARNFGRRSKVKENTKEQNKTLKQSSSNRSGLGVHKKTRNRREKSIYKDADETRIETQEKKISPNDHGPTNLQDRKKSTRSSKRSNDHQKIYRKERRNGNCACQGSDKENNDRFSKGIAYCNVDEVLRGKPSSKEPQTRALHRLQEKIEENRSRSGRKDKDESFCNLDQDARSKLTQYVHLCKNAKHFLIKRIQSDDVYGVSSTSIPFNDRRELRRP